MQWSAVPPKVRNREKASPRLVNTKPHKFAALLSRPTLSVVVAAAAKTASLVNSGHDRRMGEEVLTAQGRRGNAVSGMGCVRGEAALARRPRRREPPSLPSQSASHCTDLSLSLGQLTTGESQGSPQMPHLPPLVLHWRLKPPQYNSWSL